MIDEAAGSPVTSLGSLRKYIHRCESLPRRRTQLPAVNKAQLGQLNSMGILERIYSNLLVV